MIRYFLWMICLGILGACLAAKSALIDIGEVSVGAIIGAFIGFIIPFTIDRFQKARIKATGK
jgi:hypothetical protein